MAGNPKFLIVERNGTELGLQEEYVPEAVDITFDDTDVDFTASELQTATKEAANSASLALQLPIYTILLQYNGTVSGGTFIGYDSLIDGLSTPIVIPIKSEFRAFTFSNSRSNADYTLRFRKNSSTATPFFTISKTNTQFFNQDGISEIFNAGDTIFIEYGDDGTNASDAVIVLSLRAVE